MDRSFSNQKEYDPCASIDYRYSAHQALARILSEYLVVSSDNSDDSLGLTDTDNDDVGLVHVANNESSPYGNNLETELACNTDNGSKSQPDHDDANGNIDDNDATISYTPGRDNDITGYE